MIKIKSISKDTNKSSHRMFRKLNKEYRMTGEFQRKILLIDCRRRVLIIPTRTATATRQCIVHFQKWSSIDTQPSATFRITISNCKWENCCLRELSFLRMRIVMGLCNRFIIADCFCSGINICRYFVMEFIVNTLRLLTFN